MISRLVSSCTRLQVHCLIPGIIFHIRISPCLPDPLLLNLDNLNLILVFLKSLL